MTPMQREWLDRVARFEISGLSLEKFAAREGVSPGRLSWWRSHREYILRKSSAPTSKESLSLVRLAPISLPTTASLVEVLLPNGRLVRVPFEFDADHLERVLEVIDGGVA